MIGEIMAPLYGQECLSRGTSRPARRARRSTPIALAPGGESRANADSEASFSSRELQGGLGLGAAWNGPLALVQEFGQDAGYTGATTLLRDHRAEAVEGGHHRLRLAQVRQVY